MAGRAPACSSVGRHRHVDGLSEEKRESEEGSRIARRARRTGKEGSGAPDNMCLDEHEPAGPVQDAGHAHVAARKRLEVHQTSEHPKVTGE